MKIIKLLAVQFFLFLFFPQNTYSCTTVLLKNSNNLLVCRNLDTQVNLPGYLCVNRKGETRYPLQLPIFNCHKSEWKVKYGSVTFSAMGRGFTDGGMNEKGLVVEEMSLPDTEFLIDSNYTYLTSPQWIQYQLDNFESVDEVITNLDLILPVGWVWHFFIADRNGNSASIEFIEGKLQIHKNEEMPRQCLSNSKYAESVKYYDSLNRSNIPINLKGISNQENSLERFAISVAKTENFNAVDENESINYAFDLLSTLSGTGKFSKRSIVYDIKNQIVYFRTDSNSVSQELHFTDIDFDSDNRYWDINSNKGSDIYKLLQQCTLKSDLILHSQLSDLLFTFFEPGDKFPNLNLSVEAYLKKTEKYYRKVE